MTDLEKVNKSLLDIGIRVDSIYDLVNSRELYPEAISTLITLLKKDIKDNNIKQGIIRALTVREAKGIANKPLLEEYNITKENSDFSYRWVIGNAFTVIIEPEDVDEILSIIKNKENGKSRQMFVLALNKIKSRKDDIENVLIEMIDDNNVTSHVINTLGKLRSAKAEPKISTFINHPKALIRNEAKKALKRINK